MERSADRAVDLWSLREDVVVMSVDDEDAIVLHGDDEEIRIAAPGRALREALRRMTMGPVSLENVGDAEPDGAWLAGRAQLHETLDHLAHLVIRSTGAPGHHPVLSVAPTGVGGTAPFRPAPVAPDAALRMAPGAWIRRDGDDFAIELPEGRQQVRLHGRQAMWIVAELSRTTTLARLIGELPIPAAVVGAVVAYLDGAGVLEDLS